MKIGFSFGKCIRDIARGDVDINDVVVIVARTDVDKEHLGLLVDGYQRRHMYDGLDLDLCKKVAEDLWNAGKIHQPRKMGIYPGIVVPDEFVWMDLSPTLISDNPSVIEAWKNYQMVLKLAEGKTSPMEVAQQEIMGRNVAGF